MILNNTYPILNPTINAWQEYLDQHSWQDLIKDVTPKQSDCLLYELGNPLDRPNEDFAIGDMRMSHYSEPHYHPDGDYEIYFVLHGSAKVVIGRNEYDANPGDILIIPPKKAHYSIPDNEFIIAIVNTPPFSPDRYINVTEDDDVVGFDKSRFEELTKSDF